MKFKELMDIKNITTSDLRYLRLDKDKGWKKRHCDVTLTQIQVEHLTKRIVDNPLTSKRKKGKLRDAGFVLTSDNSQLLYLMSSGGNIKIGISKDPITRVKQLNTGSGDKIHLIATWVTTDDVSYVESFLHGLFDLYRLNGEWFTNKVTIGLVEQSIPCQYQRTYIYNTACTDLGQHGIQTKIVHYNNIKLKTDKAILIDYFSQDVWIANSCIVSQDLQNRLLTVKASVQVPKILNV